MEITGGGNTQPETVSFPGAYSGTDPGIQIDIYQTLTTYDIPGMLAFHGRCIASRRDILIYICSGPTPFSCDASSGSGSTTGAASPTTAPATSASSTISTSAPTSTSAAGTVAHYGQCGGLS